MRDPVVMECSYVLTEVVDNKPTDVKILYKTKYTTHMCTHIHTQIVQMMWENLNWGMISL